MSLRIAKIDIRNFRSIRNLTVTAAELAVLVGQNDSGKSNVLRALNLFFNEFTNAEDPLDFETDHNVFNNPNRRAKEISITLEISLPDTYHATNGDLIVWEKRWRQQGNVYDEYSGRRHVEGSRGAANVETVQIPDRSNVHALLRHINYVYVPAIKDTEYFAELRASIYGVIAESAARTFHAASHEFEISISDHLQDLTDEITKTLGFQSRLALPRDLSHVFESLDFLSAGADISLDARGDGVKARHIPMILKFMADKKHSLQVQGSAPHNFIWGYEEPENNLELGSCVELASQFWTYAQNGISQIFLTTHSPVFYNLHRRQAEGDPNISCHHIMLDDVDAGTEEATDPSDLDERMGTMMLFAPMVQDLENSIRAKEDARLKAEELAAAQRRKLFVEGATDKLIMDKTLRVFAPDHAAEIDVETKETGGGHGYVIDMLSGWRSTAKHRPEMPRAAGLVDLDKDALCAWREWNRVPANVQSAKCFKLPMPNHLHRPRQARFCIPVVLETLYDRDAWIWAKGRGHLEPQDLVSIIPAQLNQRIVVGETALDEHLHDDWAIYVWHKVTQTGKRRLAQHFSRKNDDEFRERLACLEPLVNEIVAYLFPDPPQAEAEAPAEPDQGEG